MASASMARASPTTRSTSASSSGITTSPSAPTRSLTGDHVTPRDHVGAAARFEVVERRALLSADDEQIAKALGGDEYGARAAPLEEGVRGDRAAVGEPASRQVAGAGQHCLIRRRGRGEALPGADAVLVEGHEVGECATHIHAKHALPRFEHG